MARFNLFEGSRRIALLIKIVWVIGVAVLTYSSPPYASLNFVTTLPNEPFRFTPTSDCQAGTDGMEHIYRDIQGGISTSVQLCFKAQRFDPSGKRLVPYRIDADGTMWGNGPYSDEVQAYSRARAEQFSLNDADKRNAREAWQRQRWQDLREGALLAIGGWLTLSVLQVLIGWIVRGFLGIPRGQDHPPDVARRSV